MGRGGWIAAARTAGLTAALLAFAVFAVPARGDDGCSLQQVGQAIDNTYNAATGPACASSYDNSEVLTAVVIAVGGLLAADPNDGQKLCDAANSGQGDLTTLSQYLPADVVSQLQVVADPLAMVSCACSADQGIGQLAGDIVACLGDALKDTICWLQGVVLNNPCNCTPAPPTLASCTPPPGCYETLVQQNYYDQNCKSIEGNYGPGYVPVKQTSVSSGTLVTSGVGDSCGGGEYCFCPSPMEVVYEPDNYRNDYNPSNGFFMVVCRCPNSDHYDPKYNPNNPQNTHALPGAPNVCICDRTGLVAVPPVKTTTNPTAVICPTPFLGPPCPPGEERINNQCVKPCSDPSQIQLANGKCCSPSQASSCGECCPSGQAPDPTGNCSPTSMPHPGPARPLPQPLR